MYPTNVPHDPTDVIGRRVGAFAIDAAIVAVVFFVLAFALPVTKDYARPSAATAECDRINANDSQVCIPANETVYIYDSGEIVAVVGVPALIWFLNAGLLTGLAGGSIGKLMVGLRVIRRSDGHRCGFWRGLLRGGMWIVDGAPWCFPVVGLATGLSTRGHRRVGDMVAGTLVVATGSVGIRPVVAGLDVPAWPVGPAGPWNPAQGWGQQPQQWGPQPPQWGPQPGPGGSAGPQAGSPPPPTAPPPWGAPTTPPPNYPPPGAPGAWGAPVPAPQQWPPAHDTPSAPSPATPSPATPSPAAPSPAAPSPTTPSVPLSGSAAPSEPTANPSPAPTPAATASPSDSRPAPTGVWTMPAAGAGSASPSASGTAATPGADATQVIPTISADVTQALPRVEPPVEPAVEPATPGSSGAELLVGPATPRSSTVPPAGMPGVDAPLWDADRATYIQWDPQLSLWVQWDEAARRWSPIP
jgi:uncharacterized RDD family membrane protein YckC